MTVLDNIRTSAYGPLEVLFHGWRFCREEDAAIHRTIDLLDMLNLSAYAEERAKNLPYGLQRRLEITRALAATRLKLLLLDKPYMGLAPILVKEIFRILADLNRAGMTILLVEQSPASRCFPMTRNQPGPSGKAQLEKR